ncbi:hypothetical protein LTR86_000336 [Recurvomyces mirabilis]|nr:hypothetical protein LTR86_000336 [Recurvomyces mirabilis]
MTRLSTVGGLLAQAAASYAFTCQSSASAAYNATSNYLGCYTGGTSILSAVKLSTIAMTPQLCTSWCGERGFQYGAIVFGTQCFCDHQPNYSMSQKVNDTQCSDRCTTDPSQRCGGGYIASLYQITNSQPSTGASYFTPACQTSPLCSHKVCDTSLSTSDRIASLISELTEEEKILNLVDASAGSTRIGLPPYEWWSEATHGVGSAPGVQFANMGNNFSYATSFPAPILSSAAFDDELIFQIGETVGREGRAFGNNGFAGFDYWAPNMNNFRDPRWGRGQETPGEDVLRVQNYVRTYVPGLQGGDPTNKQIIATCKHYAVYDLETGRYGNDYNPTQQDMADYYMAAFKTCVRDVGVGSIMCSYNAVDGYPSCASQYLLQDVLRDHWNFTNDYNYVVSDCGAVTDIFQYHNFTDTEEAAASVALNAGTDLECGSSYVKLNASLADGQTTIARLDEALTRLYNALFTVAFFDGSNYTALGWSDVATSADQKLAYTAAWEGMTLLKNDNSFLPLSGSKKVAVIGPYANATTQMQGDYSGTPKYINSPLSAFQGYSSWTVTYSNGTGIASNSTSGFAAAKAAAAASDVVIYLGGLDNSLEQETLDRLALTWPGNQLDLINELAAVKPTIVVQFGGGQIDDTPLLNNANVKSVVWAGYPSQDGGDALLDILTGKQAPAGRLPITQYPASYADEVSIYDIDLPSNGTYPGRTYRWYTGKAVRPFGFGLSYTTFGFSWTKPLQHSYNIQQLVDSCGQGNKNNNGWGSGWSWGWGWPHGWNKGHGGWGSSNAGSNTVINDATPFTTISASVKNTGKHVSDYVGLLFLSSSNGGPAPRPIKTLVSYSRLHSLAIGGSQTLNLPLTLGSLARANTNGDITIFPGDYEVVLDNDASLSFKFSLTGQAVVIDTLPAPKASYSETVKVNLQAPSRADYGDPVAGS